MSTSIDEARRQIIDFMVDRLGLEAEDITLTARFQEDLELDSLDMVELVTILENETGIELDDTAAEKLTSLGEVLAFLESQHTSGQNT